jgi:hypothetical protein
MTYLETDFFIFIYKWGLYNKNIIISFDMQMVVATFMLGVQMVIH